MGIQIETPGSRRGVTACGRIGVGGTVSFDMTNVYVEGETGGHIDRSTQVWTFDLAHWGLCGQGTNEEHALRSLVTTAHDAYRKFCSRHGEACPSMGEVVVVERIRGDEQAFAEDRLPATGGEIDRTLEILASARCDLVALLESATEQELDWIDPERRMPDWATWRTVRLMAWHVADTESRYYLASLGVEPPDNPSDLNQWLACSASHVRSALPTLPTDRVVEGGGEVWTTRKVLRRLAWHERGEVDAMRALLKKAQALLRS
ncbi:hypothetical protein BMS3Bbin02_00751 [bacterium BMS3Bbin02]|nr:hypothetical protein BMS3Bbin02_00751 [bacterium BMS3Bbin02]